MLEPNWNLELHSNKVQLAYRLQLSKGTWDKWAQCHLWLLIMETGVSTSLFSLTRLLLIGLEKFPNWSVRYLRVHRV